MSNIARPGIEPLPGIVELSPEKMPEPIRITVVRWSIVGSGCSVNAKGIIPRPMEAPKMSSSRAMIAPVVIPIATIMSANGKKIVY